jgi:actin-related protein
LVRGEKVCGLTCRDVRASYEVDGRVDVGGKLMTNHLKELVSFRQWNMMEETYIVNDVKEKCCYVSTQFAADLEACRFAPPVRPSPSSVDLSSSVTLFQGR